MRGLWRNQKRGLLRLGGRSKWHKQREMEMGIGDESKRDDFDLGVGDPRKEMINTDR